MSEKKTRVQIANELRHEATKGFSVSEVQAAKDRIVVLAQNAENETVYLNANKDIIDRSEGKPQQSIDHTTAGESFNISQEKKDSIKDKLKNIL